MKANELVKEYGVNLIGKKVWTEAMGDYPGGVAIVTAVNEDPGAPELVITVKHPDFESMGIFDWEDIYIIPAPEK